LFFNHSQYETLDKKARTRGGVKSSSTKKSFFTSLGASFIKGATFSLGLLFTGAIIVYAVNFPTTTPSGETPGGKFMGYFNKMLVNTDLASTDGTVKNSDKVDGLHASELGGGGLSAAGAGGKVFIVSVPSGSTCPTGWTHFFTTKNLGDNIHYSNGPDGGFLGGMRGGAAWETQPGENVYFTDGGGTTKNEFCLIFY
ncbi:MAG: hypothetical protein PHH70_03260, partial [Candidatus Gracilibacteria bacterium]|nr:hypothetical protein [Candidatus Gracilibacteria bacterium]